MHVSVLIPMCESLCDVCDMFVCLTVVGQISVVGALCGWTSRQHYASNLTATTHIQTAKERKTEGEREGGRKFDRRTGDGLSGPQNMEYDTNQISFIDYIQLFRL